MQQDKQLKTQQKEREFLSSPSELARYQAPLCEDALSDAKKNMWRQGMPRFRPRSPRFSTCQPLDGQLRSRETPTSYLQNPQNKSLSLILRMFLFFSLTLSHSLPRVCQLQTPRYEHRSYCFRSLFANIFG